MYAVKSAKISKVPIFEEVSLLSTNSRTDSIQGRLVALLLRDGATKNHLQELSPICRHVYQMKNYVPDRRDVISAVSRKSCLKLINRIRS